MTTQEQSSTTTPRGRGGRMRAVVQDGYGSSDAIQLDTIKRPAGEPS